MRFHRLQRSKRPKPFPWQFGGSAPPWSARPSPLRPAEPPAAPRSCLPDSATRWGFAARNPWWVAAACSPHPRHRSGQTVATRRRATTEEAPGRARFPPGRAARHLPVVGKADGTTPTDDVGDGCRCRCDRHSRERESLEEDSPRTASSARNSRPRLGLREPLPPRRRPRKQPAWSTQQTRERICPSLSMPINS